MTALLQLATLLVALFTVDAQLQGTKTCPVPYGKFIRDCRAALRKFKRPTFQTRRSSAARQRLVSTATRRKTAIAAKTSKLRPAQMARNIASVSSERRLRFASNFLRLTAALIFGGMPEQAPAGYYTKGTEWCGPNPITGAFHTDARAVGCPHSQNFALDAS